MNENNQSHNCHDIQGDIDFENQTLKDKNESELVDVEQEVRDKY